MNLPAHSPVNPPANPLVNSANSSEALCQEMQCPIQFVVGLLGNKWSILVLRELFGGDRRPCELLAAIRGISTKSLMQRLRELEAHGLVDRRIYAEIPPHVEYSLTPKGRQIKPVLASLHQLGTQWLDQEPCACALTDNFSGNFSGNFSE